MAETKHQEEPTLHAKRKPDLTREDNEDNPKKTQKLEAPDTNNDSSLPLHNNHHLESSEHDSSIHEENDTKLESNLLAEDDDEEEEEEEDYEDEDDDEDSENGDEKAEVDRKGKGIMRDDKGKGKLIEEENVDDDDDEDDDSDSDSGSDVSDGDSDLSDDPLAEVDLDNILPSRTRRRTAQRGVYIANDHRNVNNNGDSDA